MNLNADKYLSQRIIRVIETILPEHAGTIEIDTKLLAGEIDIDSLRLIELAEALKNEFGIDFLASENSLQDMISPKAISQAIERTRAKSD